MLLLFCGKKDPAKPSTENSNNLQGHVYHISELSKTISDVTISLDDLSGKSDKNGFYKLEDVALGKHTLSAQRTGYVDYSQSITIAEDVTEHDILLTPEDTNRYSLSGKVLDHITREPVSAVIISAGSLADTTDAAGFYEIEKLNKSSYTIRAQKDEYISFSTQISIDSTFTVLDINLVYDTVLSTNINNDVTLFEKYSPYFVRPDKESIIIAESATMTIEPGVTVEFTEGKGIYVQGSFLCAGSESAPIYFRSENADPGKFWRGLKITSADGQISMAFTKIENATRPIDLQWTGNISMESCIIENSWSGINAIWHNDISGYRIETQIRNSIIRNCTSHGGVFLTAKEKGQIIFDNCLIDKCLQNLFRLEEDVELLLKNMTISNSNESDASGSSVNEIIINHASAIFNLTKSNILNNHSSATGKGIAVTPDAYYPAPGRALVTHNNFIGNASYAISNLLPHNLITFDDNYVAGNNGKALNDVDLTNDGSGGQIDNTPVSNPRNSEVINAGAVNLPDF